MKDFIILVAAVIVGLLIYDFIRGNKRRRAEAERIAKFENRQRIGFLPDNPAPFSA